MTKSNKSFIMDDIDDAILEAETDINQTLIDAEVAFPLLKEKYNAKKHIDTQN